MDKTGSNVEADKRDETDELARELVNCDVYVVHDGRESCIGKAQSTESDETDITGEKESITVGGVPGKMVGDADHGKEETLTGNDVDGFLIDAVETEDIGCATDESELSMVHGKDYL